MNDIIEIPGAAFESEIRSATHPVLVEFYTASFTLSGAIKELLDDFVRELAGELIIRKVNVEAHPELVKRYSLPQPPTLILYDNGVPITRLSPSVSPRELKAHLQGILADYAPPREENSPITGRRVAGQAAARESDPSDPPPPQPNAADMKVIGLIGGMSWESTIEYYRLINQAVKEKYGGLHSARCILYSVDFAEVEVLQRQGQWTAAAELLLDAAVSLQKAGADLLLVCTNTMHKLADAIQAGISIPLLHIADATAEKVRESGLRRVGLLGTKFTMEQDFYRGRLADRFGLEVIIPNPEDRHTVHRVIYEELCVGSVQPDSRFSVASVMGRLVSAGAEGIILGCTELGLLVGDKDSAVPLFDTTRIHALAAVENALAGRTVRNACRP